MILLGVFPLTQSEVKRFCAIYFNGNSYDERFDDHDDDDHDDDEEEEEEEEADYNVDCHVISFPHR
jgi:hypothetical protein